VAQAGYLRFRSGRSLSGCIEEQWHDESLVRFRAEAEVTALLKHPHIVQVLDFDVSPAGVPYFVMEYLDGVDLRTVSAKGALDRQRVARLCRQIAGALEAAHDAGVIHRDLKPENVMLIEAAGESEALRLGEREAPGGERLQRQRRIDSQAGLLKVEAAARRLALELDRPGDRHHRQQVMRSGHCFIFIESCFSGISSQDRSIVQWSGPFPPLVPES
jgi:serine/threonine protein kinase